MKKEKLKIDLKLLYLFAFALLLQMTIAFSEDFTFVWNAGRHEEIIDRWRKRNIKEEGKTFAVSRFHFSPYVLMRAQSIDVSESYAYPVPFIPSGGHKTITFDRLPDEGTIRIYSAAGELVKKLIFSSPVDGKLDWDVRNSDGQDLGSDVFIYIIQSGDNKKTGKLVIVR